MFLFMNVFKENHETSHSKFNIGSSHCDPMNSFTYEKVSTPQASKDTFFLFQVSFYWIMIIIL